jgi:hypothetical protein
MTEAAHSVSPRLVSMRRRGIDSEQPVRIAILGWGSLIPERVHRDQSADACRGEVGRIPMV